MSKLVISVLALVQIVWTGAVNAGVLDDVKDASDKWIAAFNEGNYQYLGNAYTMDTTMIAHPFGDFHGRPAVTAFWKQLIADGADDLVYIEPTYTRVDDRTVLVKSRWKMNIGEGYITLEKWVKEPDGVWRLLLDDFTVEKRY